jgi:chitinase
MTAPLLAPHETTASTFFQTGCTDPVWTASGVYTQGNRVSYNNKVYEAKWWTTNENPELKSGPWDVWKLIGPCGSNATPTVSITSPANNASFNAPASITINATATDSDGTISKVDFYNGTTLLGTDTSSPYSFTWTNVAAGSYALTARATDNGNATGTSSVINVTVNNVSNPPPTTSITAPANGATFTAPANITINANASDNGSVTKVDFYNGTTLLGTDTSSPYSFSWINVAAGTYSLTTKATDNQGAVGTSGAISVTVNGTNPAPTTSITSPANGATFTAPASITINANASDNGAVTKVDFYSGSALLGTDTSSPYTFTWNNVAAGSYSLTSVATDNQGATGTSSAVSITVNGGTGCTAPQYVENGGYVAGSRVKNVGNQYECRPWPNSGWCNGQAAAYAPGTGSAWADAWTLIGPCSSNGNPPTVSISSPANGATFPTVGQVIAITASASDSDGSVTKVEFLVDGTKVGEDTSSPYSFSWTSTQGFHSLTATATDNSGNTTTSAGISITVGSGNNNLPTRIMVGYWHTWNGGVPFIKLRDVNANWDVINIAFAEPVAAGSTDGRMKFVVGGLTADYTINDFKADIQTLKSRGKKVVLSIGGYEGYFSLGSSASVTQFVNDIKGFVNEYGFDGIDIDTEQSSVQFNPGTDPDFKNPVSPKVVNMISAIRQIVNSYNSNFILSWAPETFYFQMGKQFYGGLNGNVDSRSGVYIPMIHALRDRTTYVHAQLYNSAPMQGNDGQSYTMGTVEGIVAMCEMVIQGFNVNNNSSYFFPGLRPDQVVIGVPSSQGAAGSGQISNPGLQQAFTTLKNRYPTMRGIMAWSINWDALQNNNSFVTNNRAYLNGLGAREDVSQLVQAEEQQPDDGLLVYPNPIAPEQSVNIALTKRYAHVEVSVIDVNGAAQGKQVYQDVQYISHPLHALTKGLHILKVATEDGVRTRKLIVK